MVSKQQSDEYLARHTNIVVDDALSRAYRELVRQSRRGAVDKTMLLEIETRAREYAVHQTDMLADSYLGSPAEFFEHLDRTIRTKFDRLHPCDEDETRPVV